MVTFMYTVSFSTEIEDTWYILLAIVRFMSNR